MWKSESSMEFCWTGECQQAIRLCIEQNFSFSALLRFEVRELFAVECHALCSGIFSWPLCNCCYCWRLITLQYCSGFCHTLTESAMDLHVFPIPIPPPTSLPIPSLWVFPVHQPQALVSCIQPGLVICFTLENILVSMLFSLITPPQPSSTECKSLFYTSVSLFLSCIQGYHYHLFKF